MSRTSTAVLLAVMVVLTAFGPAAVSAQESTEPAQLDFTVVQDSVTGNATVTLTNGSAAVSDTTVNVTPSVTYAVDDQYTTDGSGTFELPNPGQTVDVTLEATVDETTVAETVTLVPVEDSIDVDITQDEGGAVNLAVTQYGEPLADATVELTSTVAYVDNGTYTTDANGTVDLAEPSAETELTAAVTSGDLEEFATATVGPIAEFEVGVAPNDDGTATVTVTRDDSPVDNATVNVTSDVAYAGNGTYTTDADGTVDLPEPDSSVEVSVTATEGDDDATTTAQLMAVDTGLAVDVVQNDDGTALVTVTDDGSAVDNATVNVTSDLAYAGNGTYTTDADGTVGLPEPDSSVEVSVTATEGDDDATTTAQLTAVDTGLAVDVVQNDDGTALVTVTDDDSAVDNATVNVTSDLAYAGSGTYTTDADGTVELPNPEQNVTVTAIARNGTEEATATAELTVVENGGYKNFGQWVSAYVTQLMADGYHGPGFGQKVSEFTTGNNPGADKRPDHAGPPAASADEDDTDAQESAEADTDEAESADESESTETKQQSDKERGQPEHAKKDTTDAESSDDESDCSVDGDDESCDDDETETEETDEAGDTADEDDDRPGNSGNGGGNGGNGGGNNGNGGGNGNGRGK